MQIKDIIRKKKNGAALTGEEIAFFASNCTDSSVITDAQSAALLMAICMRGMNREETFALTKAMMESGDVVDLSRFGSLTVDKHSTGGVGDKTTLVVAPVAAALGCKVAKMSGRGLGHTGGTVDKLESFTGFNTSMTGQEFLAQVEEIGISVVGQSGNMTPADKKLYALRDDTETVDSIPLIASSIMSKKLAAGAHSIVLDVKVGSGAFMRDIDSARALAQTMVDIGYQFGRKVTAVITNMDIPLGFCVGNAIEAKEAIEILQGGGCEDLREVCVTLASNMVSLALGKSVEESREMVLGAIADGSALKKLSQMIDAQGGNGEWVYDASQLPGAKYSLDVTALQDGYISAMDAAEIGHASGMLGAGRYESHDAIDHGAGIRMHVKTGAKVCKGDVIATLYTNDETRLPVASERLESAIVYSNSACERQPLVYDIISQPSMQSKTDVMIIGIAGGTGSGKSTITEQIKKRFGAEVSVITHDNYYRAHDDMTYEERTQLNYDHPDSFETEMMIEHIRALKRGESIQCPVYDYTVHNRSSEFVEIKPTRVIIIEGILTFTDAELCSLMDIKIFVDTDADVRILRRIKRDTESRGRTVDSVMNQYLNTVKPMHDQFVEPSKKNADIIILEGGQNLVALDILMQKIGNHISNS